MIGSWIIDITPDGIRITPTITADERGKLAPGKLLDIIILIMAIGVGALYLERFTNPEEPAPPEIERSASVAVLEFDDLSDSKNNAYFAAGIQEDILNQLSKNRELIVTSRTSSLTYSGTKTPIGQIAKELDVSYILEGSVRRAGNQARISVQLIDAATDSHVWSEAFDRDLDEIFAVQGEVAQRVAEALHVELASTPVKPPTENLAAYELFLEGRELQNSLERKLAEQAPAKYEQALKLDPAFADAWAALSLALANTSGDAARQRQKETAEKAYSLDPEGWLSNAAMGAYLFNVEVGNGSEAIPFYEKAVTTNPNDTSTRMDYAIVLRDVGRIDEAEEQWIAIYRRNPLSGVGNLARALVAINDDQEAEARKFVGKAIAIGGDKTNIQFWVGIFYLSIGDEINALFHLDQMLALDPAHFPTMVFIADILSYLGDHDTADYWLSRAETIAPRHGLVLSKRGENFWRRGLADQMVDHLETWSKRDPDSTHGMGPYLDYLRAIRAWHKEDPRWREHLQRSLEADIEFLRANSSDGSLKVTGRGINGRALIVGHKATALGETAIADEILASAIGHFETEGGGHARTRHLAFAYAGQLDNAQTVAHLNDYFDQGYNELTHWHELKRNHFGMYDNLINDIGLQDVVSRMEAHNEEILADIRRELPHLIPQK